MGENADGATEAAAETGAEGKETGRLLGGRYRLGDVLGRGGMGTVWRGRDEVLGRTVAVKELRFPSDIDEDDKRRLITRTLREAKAIARIRSGSAVTVFDVVDEDDRPWIVMELVEGRSLADAVKEDGPLTPRRAAEVGLAVLDVLRSAHREGIVHRDVKPSNVLIEEDTGRVVLTDFGIAKVEGDPSVTSTGMLVGAPSYISPERARGHRPGPPADMWSLGGLLYASVEGHPPYDKGSAIATLTAVMTDPLEPPTRAGELEEVIYGLMLKDPEKRLDYVGARALLEAVLAAPDEPEQPEPSATATVALPGKTGKELDQEPGKESGEEPEKDAAKEPGKAAATSAPAPGPDGATHAMAASGPGSGRRRPLALVIGVVVVALVIVLGAVLAFALSGDGDGDGSSGTNDNAAATGGSGDGNQDDSDGSDDSKADEGDQDGGQDGDGSGDSDGSGGSDGSDGSGEDALPEGYEQITDDQFQFAMALPRVWKRVGVAGQNSGGIYSAGQGSLPKVQVDFSASPKDNATTAWRLIEAAVAGASTDYKKVGMKPVEWRDYPSVSDWEFERKEGDERVHVLNRGFKVDNKRGYAIMITCKAEEWDGDECSTLRETAHKTFQPLD